MKDGIPLARSRQARDTDATRISTALSKSSSSLASSISATTSPALSPSNTSTSQTCSACVTSYRTLSISGRAQSRSSISSASSRGIAYSYSWRRTPSVALMILRHASSPCTRTRIDDCSPPLNYPWRMRTPGAASRRQPSSSTRNFRSISVAMHLSASAAAAVKTRPLYTSDRARSPRRRTKICRTRKYGIEARLRDASGREGDNRAIHRGHCRREDLGLEHGVKVMHRGPVADVVHAHEPQRRVTGVFGQRRQHVVGLFGMGFDTEAGRGAAVGLVGIDVEGYVDRRHRHRIRTRRRQRGLVEHEIFHDLPAIPATLQLRASAL